MEMAVSTIRPCILDLCRSSSHHADGTSHRSFLPRGRPSQYGDWSPLLRYKMGALLISSEEICCISKDSVHYMIGARVGLKYLSQDMAVKVHGAWYSVASEMVFVTLFEKEVEFELIVVDILKGDHRQPEYLALQPFGVIPVLQDEDVTLFESRAIMRYVADKWEKEGTPNLHGATLKDRAQVEQWLEVQGQNFQPAILALVVNILWNPALFGKPTDENVVREMSQKLARVLDVYEAQLSKHKYLAGDSVSIADLSHLPLGFCYFDLADQQELLSTREHVAAWWADISSRPSWKKVLEHAAPYHAKWSTSTA